MSSVSRRSLLRESTLRYCKGLDQTKLPSAFLIPTPTTTSTSSPKPFTTTSLTKMRLPYVPNPPVPSTPAESEIVSRIQARRHPRPLQPLDLTLLHSPPVADGWNSFLGAVRTQTTIPPDLREIAISRVAVINRAWYEWMHHAPLAEAGGVSKAGIEFVKNNAGELKVEGDEVPEGLSEKQWVVLCYTDEMTRNVQVREGTFARLRGLFDEKEVVEITATIACYNCVSRFLVALDVGERNAVGPDGAH